MWHQFRSQCLQALTTHFKRLCTAELRSYKYSSGASDEMRWDVMWYEMSTQIIGHGLRVDGMRALPGDGNKLIQYIVLLFSLSCSSLDNRTNAGADITIHSYNLKNGYWTGKDPDFETGGREIEMCSANRRKNNIYIWTLSTVNLLG